VSVELDHTVVSCRDQQRSAAFLAETWRDQCCRVASMPVTVAVAETVMADAELADAASFHHWVVKPESPQPVENSTVYFPGSRSTSE
jgi:hypothetical protein